MLIYNRQEDNYMTLQDIQQKFNLPSVTLLESKDKYGKLVTIKELNLTVYKKDLEIGLDQLASGYDFACSKKAMDYLRKIASRDNHYARFMGMREYEPVRVELIGNGWFGVVIRFKDNGELRNFLETGLSYALKSEENMKKYASSKRTYFVAGGLDKNPDFLFHGVGHASNSEMYCFDEFERVLA